MSFPFLRLEFTTLHISLTVLAFPLALNFIASG